MFQVLETSGLTETFILWWLLSGMPIGSIEPGDRPPSATVRLLWTTQLSLLRDALVSKTSVTIYHGDTSSFVRTVQLGG